MALWPQKLLSSCCQKVRAGGEDRAVKRHGELLQPAPDRLAVDRLRDGLENSDAVILFHPPNELEEGRRAHQAVGVETDHVAILAAPAPAKIGDVAALAVEREFAAAIENPLGAVRRGDHAGPGQLLLERFFLVGRVAQDEELKTLERA